MHHNNGAVTDSGLDLQGGANLGGSGPHISEAEAFAFVQGDTGNPGTIVFYLQNQVWCLPSKADVNRGRIGVPHGIVNRLLGDS